MEIYSAEKLKTVKLHGRGGRQLQGGVVWQLRISGAASCKRDFFWRKRKELEKKKMLFRGSCRGG